MELIHDPASGAVSDLGCYPLKRRHLIRQGILISAIRGFCSTMTIPQASAPLRSAHSDCRPISASYLDCPAEGPAQDSTLGVLMTTAMSPTLLKTETVFFSPSGVLFSYAQVRGSVPVFWEQSAGLIPGSPKDRHDPISRRDPTGS